MRKTSNLHRINQQLFQTPRKSFTFVEVVISMIFFAILLTALTDILVQSFSFYNSTMAEVNMDECSFEILEPLTNDIKQAKSVQSYAGGGIIVNRDSYSVVYYFSGGKFIRKLQGSQKVIFDNSSSKINIESLNFDLSEYNIDEFTGAHNLVGINLKLGTLYKNQQYVKKYKRRVYIRWDI